MSEKKAPPAGAPDKVTLIGVMAAVILLAPSIVLMVKGPTQAVVKEEPTPGAVICSAEGEIPTLSVWLSANCSAGSVIFKLRVSAAVSFRKICICEEFCGIVMAVVVPVPVQAEFVKNFEVVLPEIPLIVKAVSAGADTALPWLSFNVTINAVEHFPATTEVGPVKSSFDAKT